VRTAVFLPLIGAVAFLLAALPSGAQTGTKIAPESGDFEIAQHGHAVGTASFKISGRPDGYDVTSLVSAKMQGLDYALSTEEQLSALRQLQHVQLNATVNGEAMHVVAAPDAAQILLNISAGGHSSTTRLAAHAAAVLLPDFDPGALQTLLALGAAQNGRDLWAILPKQSGSIDPVQLATYMDQQGTLDGKPIVVHHLVATIAGANTDLFSGPEDQLLQAELPQEGFALVRKGFVLTPSARPAAPAPNTESPNGPASGTPASQ
jgi:hypothetical protein